MQGSIICPKCHGNGFIYKSEQGNEKKLPADCDYCKNQGEVNITEDVIKDLEECKSVN